MKFSVPTWTSGCALISLVAFTAVAQPAALSRVHELLRTGKTKEAIALLDAAKNAAGVDGYRARIALGEALIDSGHRHDAEAALMKIIEDYNNGAITDRDADGLAIVGRAAFLMRSPKDANQAFNESERINKKNSDTLVWRGELFLDKYDPGHAEEVTKEALALTPKRPDALVLMARIKLEQTLDFDAAERLVKDALAIDPNHAGAFAVRVSIALHDMDITGAEKSLDAGLRANPGNLELLSLRAASRFLDDDHAGYERAKKEVFSRNPEYAHFYSIVGDLAEWEHRYDDIVTMMKDATKVDPDDEHAWAQLGLTLLRSGDEDAGVKALQTAWSKDHFNVRVFNTLNLYEKTIPNAYETTTTGVLHIRYPKDERAILERYVPTMANEAWGSMKARYGFVPTQPIQLELYATREQFSVRTSGLPNVGIQGVCFGRVVAAMSPRGEPFNWGNVVWHELGHVFAIQLSKNHVPRWFTEGLSEYETIARRPEWQRELDPELYLALKRGSLPGAVDMNRAFTHARDGSDMTVAYYAASQMLLYTVESFGMARVVSALTLWGTGAKTPEVIRKAFGIEATEYDRRFRAWESSRLARYIGQFVFDEHAEPLDDAKANVDKRPTDSDAHVGLALAFLQNRNVDEAKKEIVVALSLDSKNARARFLTAKFEKDPATALGHYTAMQLARSDGYSVEMGIARAAREMKNRPLEEKALTAAYRFDPTQIDAVRGLFDIAHEEKRTDDMIELLKRMARLDQHDRKVWRVLLTELAAQKKWSDILALGESATFVDVENAMVHLNYARALVETGDFAKGIFEAESALACGPEDKEAALAHALLAKAKAATGDAAGAKSELNEALKLDPKNAEAADIHVP